MSFFNSVLGLKWRFRFAVIGIVYTALLFWPTVVFYQKISFSPATFVQEWIKAVCSISIIFIILEYQKYIFDLNKKKALFRAAIETKIINPINDLLILVPNCATPSEPELDMFISNWRGVFISLNSVELYSFNIKLKNENLYNFSKYFGLREVNISIANYINRVSPPNICGTIDTLRNIVEAFVVELNNMK